jgi:hypothetical protein
MSLNYTQLKIELKFKGGLTSTRRLTLNMLYPRFFSTQKLYFCPLFRYSDDLLKDAGVQPIIETFTSPTSFTKLVKYGVKIEKKYGKIGAYDSDKNVDFIKDNIKYMTDLLFQPKKVITVSGRRYVMGNIKPQKFTEAETSALKKQLTDELKRSGARPMVKIIRTSVTVTVVKGTGDTSGVNFKRLECKEQKKVLTQQMNTALRVALAYSPIQYQLEEEEEEEELTPRRGMYAPDAKSSAQLRLEATRRDRRREERDLLQYGRLRGGPEGWPSRDFGSRDFGQRRERDFGQRRERDYGRRRERYGGGGGLRATARLGRQQRTRLRSRKLLKKRSKHRYTRKWR